MKVKKKNIYAPGKRSQINEMEIMSFKEGKREADD